MHVAFFSNPPCHMHMRPCPFRAEYANGLTFNTDKIFSRRRDKNLPSCFSKKDPPLAHQNVTPHHRARWENKNMMRCYQDDRAAYNMLPPPAADRLQHIQATLRQTKPPRPLDNNIEDKPLYRPPVKTRNPRTNQFACVWRQACFLSLDSLGKAPYLQKRSIFF